MRRRSLLCFTLIALMCMSLIPSMPKEVKATASTSPYILYMRFDGDLKDNSGNSLDGNCTYGNITYKEGVRGQCAVFDGKSYIEIPDSDLLDLKDNFTISFWAYKEDMNEQYVPYVYKEEDEESYASPYKVYEHWYNTPGIYLHDGGQGSEIDQYYLSGPAMDFRKWFMLSVTYDGKEVRLYHNDKLVKKESVSGVPAATIGNLYIGMLDGEVFYKGKMDELKIMNTTASANDIANFYKNDPGRVLSKPKLMVGYYKFNNDFKDYSGLGNDAVKITGEGSTKFVDAICSKGVTFTKGSYLEIKDNDSINFDEAFSITGWLRETKEDVAMPVLYRCGVSSSYASNDSAYSFTVYDDLWDFGYVPFGSDYAPTSSRVNFDNSLKNKWYHFGITFDGEQVCFYKNGVLIQKEEIEESVIAHASGNLMIGSNGTDFFEGTLDSLCLYNFKLTDKEVKIGSQFVDTLQISTDNQTKIKSLKAKATVQLKVTRDYVETDDLKDVSAAVTYKSSNTKIFTVNKEGKITAVKKGTAKLTVTHGGISKTYTVTVK